MTTINFTHDDEDKSGNDVSFEIEAIFSVEYDSDYGADADGNRGIPVHFVTLESFKILDAKNLKNDLTKTIETEDPELFKEIEDECEAKQDEVLESYSNERG